MSRAVAILLAASLAACSTVTNMYDRWFGSAPAAKPAPLVAFTPTAQARIVWQANVGAAERSVFFPAVQPPMTSPDLDLTATAR